MPISKSQLFLASILTVAVCCMHSRALSATLNIELDVQTQVAKLSSRPDVKNVAIFVLDRSGSMKKPNTEGKSPNDLLTESVRERARVLAAEAPETQVYLLPFNDKIMKMEGPFSMRTELKTVLDWDGFNAKKCESLTLLYDTLAFALDRAEIEIGKNPNTKVQIYAYTDGANETGREKYYKNENFENKKTIPVQFAAPRGTKTENDKAYGEFMGKYEVKIRQYVVAGKMDDIQWRWLGAGEPPKGVGNVRKDEYKLLLSSSNTVLKNPSVVQSQTLSAALAIPMPEEYKPRLASLRAGLSLEIGGREVSGTIVSLAPGRQTVHFEIPDGIIGDKETPGRIRLSDIPDAWDRIALKEPSPLEVKFAEPGVLSMLFVEPGAEKYVRVGDEVRFFAKASESAEAVWSLDGKPIGQGEVRKTFDRAGDYRMEVTAQKNGFKPARESVIVHALDVGVAADLATRKPTVGEIVAFKTQVKGRPETFSWWIDDQMAGGDKPTLEFSGFASSGKHKVKVRASYGHGILAEHELAFDVAAKPWLTIENPSSGSEFEFGQEIDCTANVEGDFDKVEWKISGPVEDTREAIVDRERRISKPVTFKPEKGGQFVLTAMAVGASGSLAATTEVKFKVAREDVGIAITSPASGTVIQLGPVARNPELTAEVKGDAIKRVRWTMLNQKTGETSELRVTPVQGGVATCACPSDEAIGDKVSLMIQADAVFDADGAEAVASPAIELVTRLDASLDIDAKVDGGEANGRDVTFGKQIELSAICGGCVNPLDIQWFAATDGSERQIGTGPKCMAPKEAPDGKNLRVVRYFARAKLPDGSFRESRKVTVFHCCGCLNLKARIKLPKGEDGITKISFSRTDAVHAEIESAGDAGLKDLAWDMGDETKLTGPVVEHKYGKYGEYIISATGKCKDCGKPFSLDAVQVKIEKQQVVAKFVVEPAKSSYAIRGVVHIVDKSIGDINGRKWYVDGKEIIECENKEKFDYNLPKMPGNMKFTLHATDMDGNEAKPYSISIRVRLGWWATIPASILLFSVIYISFRLFTKNQPSRWAFYTWEGAAPKQIDGAYPEEFGEAYTTKGVRRKGVSRWNYWTKKGALKLSDMLMLQDVSDSTGVTASIDFESAGTDSETMPTDVNVWTPFSEIEFPVHADDNGSPVIDPPSGNFSDETGTVNVSGSEPYFLFWYTGQDYSDAIKNGHDFIRVRVLDEGGSGMLEVIAVLVTFGLAMWAFVWFCLNFAI